MQMDMCEGTGVHALVWTHMWEPKTSLHHSLNVILFSFLRQGFVFLELDKAQTGWPRVQRSSRPRLPKVGTPSIHYQVLDLRAQMQVPALALNCL